ncbi:hypothetical protein VB779_06895 [Haloarculaceae archaeon H-GB11]|nr:hypothetical protein [Haloarculaceae archaeon H-GB11]
MPSLPGVEGSVDVLREVSLATVGKHRDDSPGGNVEFTSHDFFGDFTCSDARRAGTGADEMPLLSGEALHFGMYRPVADRPKVV